MGQTSDDGVFTTRWSFEGFYGLDGNITTTSPGVAAYLTFLPYLLGRVMGQGQTFWE